MAACLPGAYVSGFVDVASGLGVEDTAVFISPVVEERMKFLPLLFYSMMFESEDNQLLHAAVGVGAGFASFENVCSMVSAGAGSFSFLLIRDLAAGMMHSVSVFALTLGLVTARRFQALRLTSVIGAREASALGATILGPETGGARESSCAAIANCVFVAAEED